jgi:hypothetical protein
MAGQFLKRIVEKLCPHNFSWPHSGAHGQDYQVCLLCGVAYNYDWTTMQRTSRLLRPEDVELSKTTGKRMHN